MNAPEHSQAKTEAAPLAPGGRALSDFDKKRLWWTPRLIVLVVFVVLLTLAFSRQLVLLFIHAANTELHSYILFVPFVSAYLLYIKRNELPLNYCSSPVWAVLSLLCALGAFGATWIAPVSASPLSQNDDLALLSFSFVCFLAVAGFLFLGRRWMAAAGFPFAFLFFLVPLPDRAVDWLETVLTLTSTEAANLFFNIAGIPVLRDGTVFELPGISIQVAQECSGIRSTWVLFITSLLAAYMFLKAPWRRIALVAAVIPLGILRNGFRIFVIGLVCVHAGPQMINSALHRQGGPLFFALSLVPLSLLLWWLRRREAPSLNSTHPK
jgi:exosortase C (VPDSG-CTERM-specific)